MFSAIICPQNFLVVREKNKLYFKFQYRVRRKLICVHKTCFNARNMQYHSQDHCQSCVSFGEGESSQIRNNNTTGFVLFWPSCCPYTLVISLKVRDNIWNRNLVRKQVQEFAYRTRRGKRLHMGLQYYEEHAIEFFLLRAILLNLRQRKVLVISFSM